MENSELELKRLNCDALGYAILRNKDRIFHFLIQDLKNQEVEELVRVKNAKGEININIFTKMNLKE